MKLICYSHDFMEYQQVIKLGFERSFHNFTLVAIEYFKN